MASPRGVFWDLSGTIEQYYDKRRTEIINQAKGMGLNIMDGQAAYSTLRNWKVNSMHFGTNRGWDWGLAVQWQKIVESTCITANLTTTTRHMRNIIETIPLPMEEATVKFATVSTTPFYKMRVEDYPKKFEGSLMMNAFGSAMALCASVVFIPRTDFRVVAGTNLNADGNRWMAIPVKRLVGVVLESRWEQLLDLFKIDSEGWDLTELDVLSSSAGMKKISGGADVAAPAQDDTEHEAQLEATGRAEKIAAVNRARGFIFNKETAEDLNRNLIFEASRLGNNAHITIGYFLPQDCVDIADAIMTEV